LPAGPARRRSAVPLYHQIFTELRDDIASGRRRNGDALPTEHELAGLHSVSRITARRALDELALAGLAERKRRLGTRVVSPTRPAGLEARLNRAVDSLIDFGRATKVLVVDSRVAPAEPWVATRLGLEEGADVARGVRLRYLDGMPLGRVLSYLPAGLAQIVDESALARAPLLDLLREAGHEIGGGRQTISAELAPPELADVLGIDPGGPLLRIERVVSDTSGRPLLFTVAEYRADRYRISLDLDEGAPRAEVD
jgi:GntR family transcriptional regulator